MTKRNSTKKALVASILSIVLCFSMLVGSTFAWFTDSASAGVNKIVAGTLQVDLVDEAGNSLDGKTLSFKNKNGSADILWEPGCTYNLEPIRVENKGNLAFKYQVIITGIDGAAKLNEAIEWTIDYGYEEGETEGHMKGDEKYSQPITISGHMKEDAGNEYQGLTIDGISITVVATQDTVEFDSGTDQYDKDATYTEAVVTPIPEADLDVTANVYPEMSDTSPIVLDTGYSFLAADTADAAKNGVYANWHADFVVSADKDIPADALTLAGQYDAFSPNWLAFVVDQAVTAGTETRLLDTAGFSVNYAELCEKVKEFNCGAAGIGLTGTTLTVELRLYETEAPSEANNNSANVETGEYITIGTYSYTFEPKALVDEIPAEELTVNAADGLGGAPAALKLDTGYTFGAADSAETAAASPYAEWNVDFVVSVDKDVPAGALTLAGQYDTWSPDWVAFANPAAVAANEATRLLATVNGFITYEELCQQVGTFNCGAAATNDALDGATITVELRLFETVDGVETDNYEVIGSYSYTF